MVREVADMLTRLRGFVVCAAVAQALQQALEFVVGCFDGSGQPRWRGGRGPQYLKGCGSSVRLKERPR